MTLGTATALGRGFAARSWARLLLGVTTFVLACGLAEGVLRVRADARHRADFHHREPNLRFRHEVDACAVPGVAPVSTYSSNSRGVKGPEAPERARRILAVGGSTTECFNLDDASVWTGPLMRLLGPDAWVGGVDVSGFGTPQHLQLVRESPLAGDADVHLFLVGIKTTSSTTSTGATRTAPFPRASPRG